MRRKRAPRIVADGQRAVDIAPISESTHTFGKRFFLDYENEVRPSVTRHVYVRRDHFVVRQIGRGARADMRCIKIEVYTIRLELE